MCLYYVYTDDEEYRLVVRAGHKWHARSVASKHMLEEYDLDIPAYKWNVEVCSESTVIE